MEKNGYYYIKVVQHGQLIKFSTRTKSKDLATDIYNQFLQILIQNNIDQNILHKNNNNVVTQINNTLNENKIVNSSNNSNIDKLYQEYIDTCKLKKMTKQTIIFKTATKTKLKENNILQLEDINQNSINLFFKNINSYAADTQKKFVTELKAFLNNLVKKGLYEDRLFKRLDFPNFKKKVRDLIIENNHLTLIFDYLEENDYDFYFYLKTLLNTVCRPAEAVDLTLNCFDIEKQKAKIYQNKTDKHKTVFLKKEFLQELLQYCEIQNKTKNDFLFNGQDRNKEYYSKKFKKLKIELELPKEYTLYTFRHTAVTEILNSTNDIDFAAKQAGNNPETALKHYVNRNDNHYINLIEKTQSD